MCQPRQQLKNTKFIHNNNSLIYNLIFHDILQFAYLYYQSSLLVSLLLFISLIQLLFKLLMEMASSSFILGSDFKCMFSSRNTKTMSGFGALRHPHPNGLFSKCFHFHTLSTRTVSGTTKMVSDVYVGGDTSLRVNSKMYTKLDSCLVIPPTPNRAKPRAIVKFLGGAFIGVVPEVTYSFFPCKV